jgi:lipoate---protein ligase
MLLILNNNTEPYFNIATEEYLLHNFSDDVFMLYRNELSIIVGKHQNAFAEINYWFVKDKNIKVVRRLSGGGTVFHDLGNLNFTFIQNGRKGSLVDFVKFTEPILQALLKLGVPASRSGRNDLLVEGLKISGNAEHVYKNRTLHHGTLLYSSKLDDLRLGLNNNHEKYSGKAVKSFRSKVTNISGYIPGMEIDEFIQEIYGAVSETFTNSVSYYLNEKDIAEIDTLVQEKYSKWEWNLGYSPKCIISRLGKINGKSVEIEIEVEKGLINLINTTNLEQDILSIITQMNGLTYNDEILKQTLLRFTTPEETNAWLKLMF